MLRSRLWSNSEFYYGLCCVRVSCWVIRPCVDCGRTHDRTACHFRVEFAVQPVGPIKINMGPVTQHLEGTQHGSSECNTVDFGSTQHFAGTQQDPSKLNTGQEPNTIDRLKWHAVRSMGPHKLNMGRWNSTLGRNTTRSFRTQHWARNPTLWTD